MSLRNCTATLGLAALAACGTVKGDDAMMGDDQPPVDTTPPQLMTSTPGSDATKVAVIAPLTFVFDESLDPGTVNADAIKVEYVQYNVMQPVIGVVSYDDATKTVTFKPNLPLQFNGRYYVHLKNSVKDAAGNAFAGRDIAFNTNTNLVTKSVNYNTTTAVVNSWTQYTVDPNGHRSRYVYFDANGPDLVWFTADDTPRAHQEYMYAANGTQLETRGFDAGLDGIYNNGDDRITSMTKYQSDARGLTTGYTSIANPGPDQMWGTADDALNSYSTTIYEPKVVRQISYYNPGNDGMWKTADDKVSSFQEYRLDDRGFIIGYVTINAGPDQLANTTDDVISSWSEEVLDANGTTIEDVYHNSSGPDGIWLNADDPIVQIFKTETDASGFRTGYTYYNASGADMMWRTADDVVGGHGSYTNDAHGLQTMSTSYSGPGADTNWGTADDVISGYGTITLDPNGQRTDTKYYATPGPDNVWRTGDDRISSDGDYDVTH